MARSVTSGILGLLCLTGTVIGQIANDDCADAEVIEGQGILAFDNADATMDGPEAGDCSSWYSYNPYVPYDVWYCWTAPLDGEVTVDTCTGTTVDTKVVVYEGCDCPATETRQVACDDDACAFQSSATFSVHAEESYLIRIGASGLNLVRGGAGTFMVTYGTPVGELMPPCDLLFETCRTPDNWNALSSNRNDFTVADNFIPAVDGNITDLCWRGTYSNDPGDYGNVSLDTFEVRYYHDAGGVPGALLAGPFAQLLFSLEVEGPVFTGTPLTDVHREYEYAAVHDAVPVFAGECYWVEITNSSYYSTEWYWETSSWGDGRAVQDGQLGAAPDGYDALDAVAEDLTFCLDLPLADGGECHPVPINDECMDAVPISRGETFFDTAGATTDGLPLPLYCMPPGSCCTFPLGDHQVHKDIWFDFAPPCSGLLTVGLCACPFDTKVAIYEGTDCPPLGDAVACNDDACGEAPALQSEASLRVTDGGAYRIRVGGFGGAGGPGTIALDFVVMPPLETNLYDYAKFTACLTDSCDGRPCVPPLYTNRCCKAQDFDSDGDVDLDDYAGFQAIWTGP